VPSSVETEILLRIRHPPHIGNGKFFPFLAKFNETNQLLHRRHNLMKQSKTFSLQNQKTKSHFKTITDSQNHAPDY
jgi:hypothetical protein